MNTDSSTLRIDNAYLDAFDRPLVTSGQMLNGAYDRTETQYDNLGRVHLQGMPCTFVSCTQYWVTNTYDIVNRLTESQRPISSSNPTLQTTTYAYQGRTTTVTDPQSKVTTAINLVTGASARVKDHNGYYVSFNRDAFASVLSVKDSLSNTLKSATYQYGVAPFVVSTTDMDSGNWSYTVDALGEVTAHSDAKGQNFSMTYDALSRPLVRTDPDVTTTWTWGTSAASYNIGQLQSVSSADGAESPYTEAYGYDSRSRLSTKTLTLPMDSSYTYTSTYNTTTGLLDTLQYPVSTSSYQLKLQYGYTKGILATVTDAGAGTVYWRDNTTNPRGQVTQETLGNGVITNRTFDAVTGWVGAVTAGLSGTSTLQNAAFLYDYVGNVTQRQDNRIGLTENFYYDNLYRLDHSTLGGSTNLQMQYDTGGMGNIASRSDIAGGAAWTYDPAKKHEVTQAGSTSYTYTYDANGNAITRNGQPVSWSSYNYPTGISSPGESVQFEYDPERQRWKTLYSGSSGLETTYHVGTLLEKVVNGSTTDYRHYIYAGKELVVIYSRIGTGYTHRYVLEDHQSSYASLLSNTGGLDVNESFTAYGNRRDGNTWSGAPSDTDETTINGISRRGFTGETILGVSMDLTHLNGRVLDSITGRFLSADPMVSQPGNTQNWNPYSYVLNNPLTLVDPSGFKQTQCYGGLSLHYQAKYPNANLPECSSGLNWSDNNADGGGTSGFAGNPTSGGVFDDSLSELTDQINATTDAISAAISAALDGSVNGGSGGSTGDSKGVSPSPQSQVAVTAAVAQGQDQQSDEGTPSTPVTAQTASSAGSTDQLSQIVVQASRTGYLGGVPINFNLPFPQEQLWVVYPGNQIYYLGSNYGKKQGNVGANKVRLPPGFTDIIHTHPSWADSQPGPGDWGDPFPLYGISPNGVWLIYPGATSPSWLCGSARGICGP
jgi:RHS repeat-associated protein